MSPGSFFTVWLWPFFKVNSILSPTMATCATAWLLSWLTKVSMPTETAFWPAPPNRLKTAAISKNTVKNTRKFLIKLFIL